MANKLITVQEMVDEINAAFPEIADQCKMTPEKFHRIFGAVVKQYVKQSAGASHG